MIIIETIELIMVNVRVRMYTIKKLDNIYDNYRNYRIDNGKCQS